ncbi:WXG100 family type VII secretion target [Paenibacillus anaericanus]|uniref:WXG100 family type VII secretion target n=1 Tax=Paenibacillus anaericanus TaxID=170367 RepID=UPI0027872A7A|nr:WXG100 family type VII secretion target [Paenibacillus anaericanus]MDQ0087471.1 WXG100 family type VII secretion target [Paenibacillus anaericanus]
MSRILITPEEMDRISTQFKTGATQSQEISTKLNSAIQAMQGQWDGMTQQRFFQRYETDKKNMQTYIQMLNEVSDELKTISDRFRAADQQS